MYFLERFTKIQVWLIMYVNFNIHVPIKYFGYVHFFVYYSVPVVFAIRNLRGRIIQQVYIYL